MEILAVIEWAYNVEVDVDVLPDLLVFADDRSFLITYDYDEGMPAIVLAAIIFSL